MAATELHPELKQYWNMSLKERSRRASDIFTTKGRPTNAAKYNRVQDGHADPDRIKAELLETMRTQPDLRLERYLDVIGKKRHREAPQLFTTKGATSKRVLT